MICTCEHLFQETRCWRHPKTRCQRQQLTRHQKPQRNNLTLKRVGILLYFTSEIPSMIFPGSNHLVSVCLAVIKLNLTRFASVSTYLHLFQEMRCRRHQKTRCQRHQKTRCQRQQMTIRCQKLQRNNLTLKRVRILLYFTSEIPSMFVSRINHLVSVCLAVIKLNQTRFASISTYLHPFQETRHQKTRCQRQKKTRSWRH